MEIDATELCTFNHNALPVAIDCDVCFGLSQSYYFTRYQKIRIQNVPMVQLDTFFLYESCDSLRDRLFSTLDSFQHYCLKMILNTLPR